MDDNNRGIYRKFNIERTDGSSAEGGKHHGCSYFVLDLSHDPFAIPALEAYAKACKESHPELSKDISTILRTHSCGCRSVGECTHWLNPQTPAEMANKLMSDAEAVDHD